MSRVSQEKRFRKGKKALEIVGSAEKNRMLRVRGGLIKGLSRDEVMSENEGKKRGQRKNRKKMKKGVDKDREIC